MVHKQDSFCRPLISCWLLRGAARREGNYLQSVQKHIGPDAWPMQTDMGEVCLYGGMELLV